MLRYLRETLNLGIIFDEKYIYNDNDFPGFSDPDYAGILMIGRALVVTPFCWVVPFAWQSRLQSLQAISTCEAEYIVASDTVKEVQ